MEVISTNNCPLLTETQVTLLHSQGIKTLMDFLTKDNGSVQRAASITPEMYRELANEIMEYIRPAPVNAMQFLSQGPQQEPLLSTGISKYLRIKLDECLGGGLGGGEILEICGEYNTGKTQLCMRIAAQFAHFSQKIPKPTVIYFDFKNDFLASRFLHFCENKTEDLENIIVIRPTSFLEMFDELKEIERDIGMGMSGTYFHLKLIIFDSLPAIIYPAIEEDSGSWRYYQEKLVEKVRLISKLNQGAIILFVNHCVKGRNAWKSRPSLSSSSSSSLSSTDSIFSDKPAMGKYWLHVPNFRLRVARRESVNNSSFFGILEKSSRTESMKKFNFTVLTENIESS